jgi:hypothetical protein
MAVACASPSTSAEDAGPAVYQRIRTNPTIARTNGAPLGGYWGGGYPGFYNPWFAPQVFSGTWYQRPYPDHLIYNNVRSGMPPAPNACGIGEADASASVPIEMHVPDSPRAP